MPTLQNAPREGAQAVQVHNLDLKAGSQTMQVATAVATATANASARRPASA